MKSNTTVLQASCVVIGGRSGKQMAQPGTRAQPARFHHTFAWESWAIIAIGIADLVTTLVWIHFYGAQEANPLFAFFWRHGVWAFIAAKSIFLMGPLIFLEWARRSRPRFVLLASRFVIVAYLLLYVVGVARLNASDYLSLPSPDLQIACK
ncbi:MAG TPA: DUF5658 family protein [Chthonomonadaceae bacterium]|nr:DUF5658 family protein [Chthonomonadaceae bacterium]